jgi:hypothetical protein
MAKDDNESQQQPYDRALKSLMEDHSAEMVPELVPGARFIEEKNNELTRLNLRADIVYLIEYNGELRILNMEMQTDVEKNMAFRMLVYHLELYDKYELPVISVVLYPFETSIPEPVFQTEASSKTRIRFDHDVLCLWTIDAEPFLQRRIISMYTLLPAMKGISSHARASHCGDGASVYWRTFAASSPTLSDHLAAVENLVRSRQADCGEQHAFIR